MKLITVPVLIALMLTGCGEEPRDQTEAVPEDPGTIVLTANGEDFVSEGFISRDGWDISFDHVFVTLAEIQPARTDPPFRAESDREFIGERDLMAAASPVTVDLASDSIVEVARLSSAPVGQYNALSWKLVPSDEGPSAGYSILLQGTAVKDDITLPLLIGFESSWLYEGGEYVGEERRGRLDPDGEVTLEMTFHLDHLFGDGTLPSDDPLNTDAPGFELFAEFADSARVTDMALLEQELPEEEFLLLGRVLAGLGHVGEGHARCTELPPADRETAPIVTEP